MNEDERLLLSTSSVIKGCRRESGISQEKLGALAGLDRTYISGIERGIRNPTLRSLSSIIVALNVSHELFFDKLVKELISLGK